MQVLVLKKLLTGKKIGNVGKAEVKIGMIIFYYVTTGVMSLVAFTYFEIKAKANRSNLITLFLCESTGNMECDINLTNFDSLNILATVVIIMVAFFPVVIVLFSWDPQATKTSLLKRKKSFLLSRKASTKTSFTTA